MENEILTIKASAKTRCVILKALFFWFCNFAILITVILWVLGAIYEKQSKQWWSKPSRSSVSKILRTALSLPENSSLKGVHMGDGRLKKVRSALSVVLSDQIPEAFHQYHFDKKVGEKNKRPSEQVLWDAAFCGRVRCTGHCKEEDQQHKNDWSKSGTVYCPVEARFWLTIDKVNQNRASAGHPDAEEAWVRRFF